MKFFKKSKVYANDPWAYKDCTEGYSSEDKNYQWWNQINLEDIYNQFKIMLKNYDLTPYCIIIRSTSEACVNNFQDESIDILHIDGNHSEDFALRDAMLYFPKVKKNGYIWFDDVNWTSTSKAINYLKEHCTLNLKYSIGNDCYLFQRAN